MTVAVQEARSSYEAAFRRGAFSDVRAKDLEPAPLAIGLDQARRYLRGDGEPADPDQRRQLREFVSGVTVDASIGAVRRPEIRWKERTDADGRRGSLLSLGPALWLGAYGAAYVAIRCVDWIQHALTGSPHGGTIVAPEMAAKFADNVATTDRTNALDRVLLPLLNPFLLRPTRTLWCSDNVVPLRAAFRRRVLGPSVGARDHLRLLFASNLGHVVGGALAGLGYKLVFGGPLLVLMAANAVFRVAFPFVDDRFHAHDILEKFIDGTIDRVFKPIARTFGNGWRLSANGVRRMVRRPPKDYTDRATKSLLKRFERDKKDLAPEFAEPDKGFMARFTVHIGKELADNILGKRASRMGDRERYNLARVLLQFAREHRRDLGDDPWTEDAWKDAMSAKDRFRLVGRKLGWELRHLAAALNPRHGKETPTNIEMVHENEGAFAIATAIDDAMKSADEQDAVDRVVALARLENAEDELFAVVRLLVQGIDPDDLHHLRDMPDGKASPDVLIAKMRKGRHRTNEDLDGLARSLVRTLDALDHPSVIALLADAGDQRTVRAALLQRARIQRDPANEPDLSCFAEPYAGPIHLAREFIRRSEDAAARRGRAHAVGWNAGTAAVSDLAAHSSRSVLHRELLVRVATEVAAAIEPENPRAAQDLRQWTASGVRSTALGIDIVRAATAMDDASRRRMAAFFSDDHLLQRYVRSVASIAPSPSQVRVRNARGDGWVGGPWAATQERAQTVERVVRTIIGPVKGDQRSVDEAIRFGNDLCDLLVTFSFSPNVGLRPQFAGSPALLAQRVQEFARNGNPAIANRVRRGLEELLDPAVAAEIVRAGSSTVPHVEHVRSADVMAHGRTMRTEASDPLTQMPLAPSPFPRPQDVFGFPVAASLEPDAYMDIDARLGRGALCAGAPATPDDVSPPLQLAFDSYEDAQQIVDALIRNGVDVLTLDADAMHRSLAPVDMHMMIAALREKEDAFVGVRLARAGQINLRGDGAAVDDQTIEHAKQHHAAVVIAIDRLESNENMSGALDDSELARLHEIEKGYQAQDPLVSARVARRAVAAVAAATFLFPASLPIDMRTSAIAAPVMSASIQQDASPADRSESPLPFTAPRAPDARDSQSTEAAGQRLRVVSERADKGQASLDAMPTLGRVGDVRADQYAALVAGVASEKAKKVELLEATDDRKAANQLRAQVGDDGDTYDWAVGGDPVGDQVADATRQFAERKMSANDLGRYLDGLNGR
jgi:hypothetical protein